MLFGIGCTIGENEEDVGRFVGIRAEDNREEKEQCNYSQLLHFLY